MKGRALLLVLLILLSTFAIAWSASADAEETRSPGTVQVKLYMQMSVTETSLSTVQSTDSGRTTTSLDFTSVDLEEKLLVKTVDTGVGTNKGFEAFFSIAAGIQGATVTISVLEDDDVVAEQERDIPSAATRTDWRIPLLDDADQYTFARNSEITLRVEANRNVIIRTDDASFLELYCEDHLSINTETRDVEGRRASTFYPNDLLENRHILIEGDIQNPFGSGDIAGVNVTIRRPDGSYVEEDEPAAVGADLNYTYDWSYGAGLPSGLFSINVTGRDRQGHEFSTQGSFMMAEYGVRMFAEGEEGGMITDSTTPGAPAKYVLTVLNIGGKRGDIGMDEGDLIPLWSTSFSRNTFSLDAGNDEDVTFDVMPSSILKGGNESEYTVTCTINNDPGVPKESDSIIVRTYVTNDVDLQVLPEEPDAVTIAVGGTKDYTFTTRNIGEFPTNVDLTRTGVPTGWSAQFVGERVTDNTIEDLRPMEIVDIVLHVNAPTTSDVTKATIKVKIQSREYTDVFEERTFVFNLVIGLVLTPTTPTDTTQDPGDEFPLIFEARNNDPSDAHEASFSVEQENANWPASSFKFTPSTLVNIPADSKIDVRLQVTVPTSAKADVFRFKVRGLVDGNSEVYATFDFKVTINLRRDLGIEMDPDASKVEVNTKDESIIYLMFENRGNQVENVNITVGVDSSDIDVMMNDAHTSIILNMPIQPGDTEQVKVSFKAKDSAPPNQAIRVTITTEAVGDSVPNKIEFDLEVKLSNSELAMRYLQWAVVIIAMIAVMFALLLWNPRKRRTVEAPVDKKDKDASHGTVVRH